MPHVIELFVADHCPGCPDARQQVHAFARQQSDVIVVERNIDHGDAHIETARRYGLFATPAIVIDGRVVLYGAPTVAQLAARCARPVASPAL